VKRTTMAVLLAAALAGCTTMTSKVENFPELRTTVRTVPDGNAAEICGTRMLGPVFGPLALVISCATIDLDKGTCEVILPEHAADGTLEHELDHCRGEWHGPGLQAYYDDWKRRQ
jgi:hypothetical protein